MVHKLYAIRWPSRALFSYIKIASGPKRTQLDWRHCSPRSSSALYLIQLNVQKYAGYKFGAARQRNAVRIHKTKEAHTDTHTHTQAHTGIHLLTFTQALGLTHERNEPLAWPKKSNCHLNEPFDLFSFDLGGNCDSSVSGASCRWRFSNSPFLEHTTRPSWKASFSVVSGQQSQSRLNRLLNWAALQVAKSKAFPVSPSRQSSQPLSLSYAFPRSLRFGKEKHLLGIFFALFFLLFVFVLLLSLHFAASKGLNKLLAIWADKDFHISWLPEQK